MTFPFPFVMPSVAAGGNDEFTKLLLHFDGADGSTTFIDSSASAHVMMLSGPGLNEIDTAQSVFGGSSYRKGPSTTIYAAASADWNFGTGSFTVDTWIRFASTSRQYIFDVGINGSILVISPTTGVVEVYGPSSHVINAGSTPFSTDVWYHIALVRDGNSWTVYRDGVAYASATDSRSWGSSSSLFLVGQYGDGGIGMDGWMDEFRVSKGIARWTANFTPPTRPYG